MLLFIILILKMCQKYPESHNDQFLRVYTCRTPPGKYDRYFLFF